MALDPDIVACAQIVERGDPDRFTAAMAAPVVARDVLFPLYAFNVEVARAPWVTQEPMIAQMRLQWWSDVLTEIKEGGPVRRHEVSTPLAGVLSPVQAAALQALVEARRRDIERVPFDDIAAFERYLDDTAGALAQAGAAALGAAEPFPDALKSWARATGFVRYCQAVPILETRGKLPLPDGRPEVLQDMARAHLAALRRAPGLRGLRRALGPRAGAAVLEFWQTRALLQRVAAQPSVVPDGRLDLGAFEHRWRLVLTAW